MDHEWIKIQSDLEINVTPANTLVQLLPGSSLSLEAGRINHAGLSSRWATIHAAAVVKQATFIHRQPARQSTRNPKALVIRLNERLGLLAPELEPGFVCNIAAEYYAP